DAAIGMHGAGGYRAQCGLVEGTLLFVGIYGKILGFSDAKTIELCRLFAQRFEHEFSSLLCRELRPEGFNDQNPPHLCEPLTVQALIFSIAFVKEFAAGKATG
ncbi:MAG: C-GCAxxG-C-C family protein, partial [Desulfocapsaceae bacterium]|nr:C-GCAxxG-C-C family protein [Desulfocapsaceae bacterium]